jgi:hypothetical protein
VGTDISSFVERKANVTNLDGTTQWHWDNGPLFVNTPAEYTQPWEPFPRWWRDSALFGFLAGVRVSCVPMLAPKRGLPDNVSSYVRDQLGCPQHTDLRECEYQCVASWGHSWFSAAELAVFDWDTTIQDPEFLAWHFQPDDPIIHARTIGEFIHHWRARFDEIIALDPNPENIRIVFAFDN